MKKNHQKFTVAKKQLDLLNDEVLFGIADFKTKDEAKHYVEILNSYYPESEYVLIQEE